MYVDVSGPTKQFSGTQAGSPTIQLNSDTVYAEIALDSAGWGLDPTRLPAALFKLQLQVQVVTCASDQTVIDNPLLGFD